MASTPNGNPTPRSTIEVARSLGIDPTAINYAIKRGFARPVTRLSRALLWYPRDIERLQVWMNAHPTRTAKKEKQ